MGSSESWRTKKKISKNKKSKKNKKDKNKSDKNKSDIKILGSKNLVNKILQLNSPMNSSKSKQNSISDKRSFSNTRQANVESKNDDKRYEKKEDIIEKKKSVNKSENNSEFSDGEDLVKKYLGFSSFSSTKGKNHTSTSISGVYKASNSFRKYRQYMNRKGGHNKPLDND